MNIVGHARMALEAACMYVEAQPADKQEQAWKRVMAGFVLADGLPTTPDVSNYHLSVQLSSMLHEKAKVSHQLHANSRVKVIIASETGEKRKQGIADWLHPKNFQEGETNFDFLRQLAEMKPWVVKGKPEKSLLVREIGWGGRMFGAFSVAECKLLEDWIRRLGSHIPPTGANGAYRSFTGRMDQMVTPTSSPLTTLEKMLFDPSAPRAAPQLSSTRTSGSDASLEAPQTISASATPSAQRFLALYFISLGLLEQTIVIPSRLSNPIGMRIVQYLRAMHGFNADAEGPDSAVSGMDEVTDIHPSFFDIGLAIARKHDLPLGDSLSETLGWWSLPYEDREMLEKWMSMSFHHVEHRDRLLGAALAAAKTTQSPALLRKLGASAEHVKQADLLSAREIVALEGAIAELGDGGRAKVREGFQLYLGDIRRLAEQPCQDQ